MFRKLSSVFFWFLEDEQNNEEGRKGITLSAGSEYLVIKKVREQKEGHHEKGGPSHLLFMLVV